MIEIELSNTNKYNSYSSTCHVDEVCTLEGKYILGEQGYIIGELVDSAVKHIKGREDIQLRINSINKKDSELKIIIGVYIIDKVDLSKEPKCEPLFERIMGNICTVVLYLSIFPFMLCRYLINKYNLSKKWYILGVTLAVVYFDIFNDRMLSQYLGLHWRAFTTGEGAEELIRIYTSVIF